jgi:hypothetical protein
VHPELQSARPDDGQGSGQTPATDPADPRPETDPAHRRRAKILWIVKGGGRWGLDLNEIAWSARLDQQGRDLFPAAKAVALAREACQALEADGLLQRRGDFYRLVAWRHEPW